MNKIYYLILFVVIFIGTFLGRYIYDEWTKTHTTTTTIVTTSTMEFTKSKCEDLVLQSGFKIGETDCTCFKYFDKWECFHPGNILIVVRCEEPNWDSCNVGDDL